MSFPSSTDSFQGFTSNETLQAANHASQHNQEQAAIVALETKVGTGASTPTSGTLLRGNGTGSSWSQANLTTDVTGILPVQNGGTGVATVASFLSNVYPVGCIYIETTGVNPGTTFGFGTWAAYSQGRVLVGAGTSDQNFVGGASGGESNHTLTSNEMPSHTHTMGNHTHNINGYVTSNEASGYGLTSTSSFVNRVLVNTSGGQGSNGPNNNTSDSTGGGTYHNNLQPYIVVFMWTRTA